MSAVALSGQRGLREFSRWGASFAIVLGLHVAALTALVAYRTVTVEPGEALPAVMIDMAPPPAAPNRAPASDPPQEEVAEAAAPEPVLDAPPEAPLQTPPVDTVPVPPRVVREPAAVALPPPPKKAAPPPAKKAERKPEKPQPKRPPKPVLAKRGEERQEARQEERRPAQRAAGAQTTASVPSTASGSSAASRAAWQGALVAALNRAKRPQAESGSASVRFSIDRGGRVLSAGLAGASGVASLDGEAVALVRRANLPPPPPDVPGGSFTFTVPIRFTVR